MKPLKTTIALFAFLIGFASHAQDKKPLSTPETATGKIGNATVTINYSSPSVRDREIWGALVPYGKIWRAGANAATTFETDKALTIEGKELPAGKYSVFIIPSKGEAAVIFNKDLEQRGTEKYNQTQDQLRVGVKTTSIPKTEKLTYVITAKGFALNWDTISIPVSAK